MKGLEMVSEIDLGMVVGLKVTVGMYVSVTGIVEMIEMEMMVGADYVLVEGMQASLQEQTLRF
jgi:hypothetical protein